MDGGLTWIEVTHNGLPSQFGFPLVTHPRDPRTFWIIPLNGDDRGRFVPDGSAAVWKSTLPQASRNLLSLLGPGPELWRCAGVGAARSPGCYTSWRDWGEASDRTP